MIEEQAYVPCNLGDFPDIPLLNLFSFLDIKEKLKCAQVCKRWNGLIYSPTLWKRLNVMHKSDDGKCYFEYNYYDSQTHDNLKGEKAWMLLDGGYIRVVDNLGTKLQENCWKADMLLYKKVISEYKMLIGCLENLLPKVGSHVKNLSLIANSGLSDFIFNLYLILCPNVEHVDARCSSLTSDAFRGVYQYGSCRKIKTLNLMGCNKITDNTLRNLVDCWNREWKLPSNQESGIIVVPYSVQLAHYICSEIISFDDSVIKDFFSDPTQVQLKAFDSPLQNISGNKSSFGLKYLSLAGCTKITDRGLGFLANCKFISFLEVLDVSGCSNLTSEGLNMMTKACPKLKACNLFYCDMISDGPYYKEANGCQTERGVCCMN